MMIFFVTLESIIDRIPPKMALLEYNVPIMGIDSTSPSSIVNSPTYIFDNIFIFSIFDRMMHYKHDAKEYSSSLNNWKEKCELKDKDIIECMKNIASLQSTIVKQAQESNSAIKGKDHVIDGLQSEVSKIAKESKREIDNTKAMFQNTLATYENTIKNLRRLEKKTGGFEYTSIANCK
jgi:hypothetical protein